MLNIDWDGKWMIPSGVGHHFSKVSIFIYSSDTPQCGLLKNQNPNHFAWTQVKSAFAHNGSGSANLRPSLNEWSLP